MRRPLSLFLPFVLLISGCSSAKHSPELSAVECPAIHVPIPRVGTEATFKATGAPWSIDFDSSFILDWGLVDGKSSPSTMNLPTGSTIHLGIATPEPRLTTTGTFANAYRISMSAQIPGEKHALVFGEEWLGAEGSGLSQAVNRNMVKWWNGLPEHDIRFGQPQHPAAFDSSPFWGRTLTAGLTGTLNFTRDLPIPSAISAGGLERMQWRVDSTDRDERGACRAHIQIDFQPFAGDPSGHPWRILLDFENDTAFPTHSEVRFSRSGDPLEWQGLTFQMDLLNAQTGEGDVLNLVPYKIQATAVPVGGPQGDLLFDMGRVFPTDWPTAWSAIQGDPASSAWLGQHPGARLFTAEHRLGPPGGGTIDAWTLQWTDGRNQFQADVVKSASPLPGVLPNATKVTGNPISIDSSVPAPLPQRFSLSAIAAIHERLYGAQPEVLFCQFAMLACQVGTHSAMGMPYYGDSPAPRGGLTLAAMIVEIGTGRILGDQGLADEVVR